jgi:hypothetical protein
MALQLDKAADGYTLAFIHTITKGHPTLAGSITGFHGFTLVFFQISQPELGDGKHIRLETLANELASHAQSCKKCP